MISDLTPTLSCADSLWFGGGGFLFFFIPNHFACNQLQLCQQCTKWEKSGVRRGGRIFSAVCQKEMSNLAAFVYVCFRKTNPVLDTIFDSIYYSQPASRFERLGPLRRQTADCGNLLPHFLHFLRCCHDDAESRSATRTRIELPRR